MIVGIGSDLANIERIENSIAKFNQRFLNKIFADSEMTEMLRRSEPGKRAFSSLVAKRFAAKEACSKALGTGFQQGTFWRDMIVIHEPSGKPSLQLSNGALLHAKRLCNDGKLNVLLTMTDDYPWAQAFVVIEKI